MTDSTRPNLGRFIWRESMSQNAAKTKTFYAGLFGWKFLDMDMGPGGTYTIIQNGGGGPEDLGIGGIMQMPPDKAMVPTHWESYAYVRDVDAAMATAKDLGGKVHWGPMDVPNVGRMGGVAAFDGASLSVMTPSRPDMPRKNERPPVGTFCWETLTTSDVDRSKTFWCKTLGWSTSTGAGQPVFTVGNESQDMVADIQKAQGPVPPNWLTFVVVQKIETTLAKATELGGKVMMGATPIPNMGRMAVLLDDQGAAIGIFESA